MAPKKRRISITARDLDGMTRMGIAEARSMTDPRAYTSVIDAITNREAAQSYFGRNTQEILNKRTRRKRNEAPVYHFTPLRDLPYEEDDEGFPLDKKWQRLRKAPYHEEMHNLQYLAQQAAGAPQQSVPGKPTNYLNRRTAGETALRTWARDSGNWPVVGTGKWTHSFGVPTGDPVPPDSEIYLDPELQERLRTHFPERYPNIAPLEVSRAPSRNPMSSPPVRMPAPGPWLRKLMDGAVTGFGPSPTGFEPRYPRTKVTVLGTRRRD